MGIPATEARPFHSQWLRQGLVPDLVMLLSALQKEEAFLLKSGKLSKKLTESLSAQLEARTVDREPGRLLDFLLDCALELGLIRTSQRRILVSPHVEAWLARPRLQSLGELFGFWKSSSHWDELYRLPGLKVEATGLRISPQSARKFILDELAKLEPGRWFDLAEWIRGLKASNPFFYRPLRDERNWKLKVDGQGATEITLGEGAWFEIEGRIIACTLAEPCHWLGLTALGHDGQGHLRSFQLTKLGACLLGQIPPSELESAPAPEEIHLQPNFEILVPQDLDLAIRYHIERFAERTATDSMLTYQLTRASVLEALAAGESVESLLTFLQSHNRRELPQNVVYSLRSWERLYGQIHLRPIVLLQTSTEEQLDEMLHHPELRPFLENRLGPRACEIKASESEALEDKLQEAGHLPKMDPALRAGPAGHLAVDDQEAYCLALALLTLQEQAVAHRMSPKDQSLESLLRKLRQLNDGETVELAKEDFSRAQKEKNRRQKQAQSIVDETA